MTQPLLPLFVKLKSTFLATILLCTTIALCGCASSDQKAANSDTAASDGVTRQAEGETATEETVSTEESTPADSSQSLAKRLCGKYSYHVAQTDTGEDEYAVMEVLSFGDNLYAFCGLAMGGDGDSLESYSFWASEFLPLESDEMKSVDGDSVKVNELCFSVMSKAGKYWDSGQEGTITYTKEGLLFEGFEGEDFLCPAGDSRLFLKDERVEETFPYVKEGSGAVDEALSGLWKLDAPNTPNALDNPNTPNTPNTSEKSNTPDTSSTPDTNAPATPVYLDFQGPTLTIYRKRPDAEVYFAKGGCTFTDGGFSCRASAIENGGMPYEWEATYQVDGDTLTITMEGDALPEALSGEAVLHRAKEADIPVVSAGDVVLGEDTDGSFQDGTGAFLPSHPDGFYGIWVAATTEEEDAHNAAKKLADAGFPAYVAYSPEWEKLNAKPFYCVTAGRYDTEGEAEKALAGVKSAGYPDAYVKGTGTRKNATVSYVNAGDITIEVSADRVVLKDIDIKETKAWDPQIDEGDNSYRATLVIDKETVFGEACETQFFGNYEEGDTPLEWFKKNYELSKTDPDAYMANGPALSGVFEIAISGGHVDQFLGSYWWD